jgi:hypothetical protein
MSIAAVLAVALPEPVLALAVLALAPIAAVLAPPRAAVLALALSAPVLAEARAAVLALARNCGKKQGGHQPAERHCARAFEFAGRNPALFHSSQVTGRARTPL